MRNVNVYFRHLRYDFPDEQLIRYGSPYFDANSAGLDLLGFFKQRVITVSEHRDDFDPRHLLAANEAFPEAALADPLADLEVWDDWRAGLRAFPYPGTYSKLGITQQEAKTSATSSVGVLGEIMAGIYAQAGLSPWVLVRVIRHWPDFIFALGNDRYAFVEAKAHTGDAQNSTQGIPNKLLAECLVTAIQQLNADPFVQVWGAFTCIQSVTPLDLRVTFLQLDTDDSRRKALTKRVLPDVVLNGLAERALNNSLHRVEDKYFDYVSHGDDKLPNERSRLEAALVAAAMQELETMLVDQELRVVMLQSRAMIQERIRKIAKKVRPQETIKARRLFDALRKSTGEGMSRVRSVGAGALYAGRLSMSDYAEISHSWSPEWRRASIPWRTINDIRFWRCGGAVFAITEEDLEGRSVG